MSFQVVILVIRVFVDVLLIFLLHTRQILKVDVRGTQIIPLRLPLALHSVLSVALQDNPDVVNLDIDLQISSNPLLRLLPLFFEFFFPLLQLNLGFGGRFDQRESFYVVFAIL